MSKIYTVTLPDIGEGVVEGEVVEWLKEVGDSCNQDEPIVVVMTDKATVELPAPYPGILTKKYYSIGGIAIKGKPLYDIETEKEIEQKTSKTLQKEIQQEIQQEIHQVKKEVTSKEVSYNESSDKVLATPSVRAFAKELGIDINSISGTGPQGRVTKNDIREFLSKKASIAKVKITQFPDDEIEPIVGIKRLMVESMALSKREAAHFSYFEQVDATRLVQLRQRFKEQAEEAGEGVRITYIPFIIKALSIALKKFPHVNSCINRETYELLIHKQQNIGIAITTELGLIVPVLKNVQSMSLEEIIRSYEELKLAALTKKLNIKDMKESTITISNFGVLGGGGMWATPVINYPEVAILAFAKIHKQPIVKNDELVVRDVLNLSWSFDHRVIDGDTAANFSHCFAELLQNPAGLL